MLTLRNKVIVGSIQRAQQYSRPYLSAEDKKWLAKFTVVSVPEQGEVALFDNGSTMSLAQNISTEEFNKLHRLSDPPMKRR